MNRFIGRQQDIEALNAIVARPGAHLLLVYGRRRVGKTTLLLRWAQQTGRPLIYWVARRDTPALVRQSFVRAIWTWAYPPDHTAAA